MNLLAILRKYLIWQRLLKALPIIVILTIAAFLRLYKISEYMTFLGDEGRDVIIVRKFLVEGDVPFLGPTASVGGFFLGPMYYYLMAPFLFLWNFDPTGPAVMVALFGILTVYLVYKLGSELFSPITGLVSASLYALSPLVISYSRSSWNPNLVPFSSLLLIYLLWRYSRSGSGVLLFAIGIVCGIGLQFHYLFLFLFFVVVIWILYANKLKRIYISTILVISGFLVGHLPFILFELKNGFPNLRSIYTFIVTGKDTGFELHTFFQTVENSIFRLFGRLLFRMPQEEIWLGLYDMRRWVWEVPIWIVILCSIGILFRLMWQWRRAATNIIRYKRDGVLLLLLWFAESILLFGFYRRAIYDYYFGILFPFPFIAIGALLWRIVSVRFGGILLLLLWGSIAWWNLLGQPFQYAPNNQLGQMRTIALRALDLTGGKPFNFALITNFNSDHAYRYFFEVAGQKPIIIENRDNDPERRSVTKQLIIICEIECQPLGHPLWEVAGFGQAEIDQRVQVPFVTIYRLIRYNKENE